MNDKEKFSQSPAFIKIGKDSYACGMNVRLYLAGMIAQGIVAADKQMKDLPSTVSNNAMNIAQYLIEKEIILRKRNE